MAILPDLTGHNIQDTYKRVLTVGDDGLMYDGTGSLYTPLSASHEITTELSSSHAVSADSASYVLSSNCSDQTKTQTNNDLTSGFVTWVDSDNGAPTCETHYTSDFFYLNPSRKEVTIEGRLIVEGSSITFESGSISASNNLYVGGTITASANISASGTIYSSTGSFTRLIGNSPITVGSPITFQSTITASGDIRSDAAFRGRDFYITEEGETEEKFNRKLLRNLKRGFSSDTDSAADGGYDSDVARLNKINTDEVTTAHITASGDISSSGTGIFNRLDVEEYIYHKDDNTYIRFLPDRIIAVAGNQSVLNLNVGANDVQFGHAGQPSTLQGSTLTLTGNITASGDISASGTLIAQDVIAGGVFETNLKTQNIGDNLTGTIVVWEEDKLIPCNKSEDELVMGVIRQGRDEPIVLGAEPVLVTGKVNIGEYIVTSDKQGHGKSVNVGYLFKKNLFGKVIGQALESSEGENSLIKCMIRKM